MSKRLKVNRIGRSKDARTALVRSLARNLFEKGAIETSSARAKVLSAFIDRTLRTSKNTLSDQKRINSTMAAGRELSQRIAVLASSLENGKSATRTVRLGTRLGDASSRVKIELVTKLPEKKVEAVKPKEAKTKRLAKKNPPKSA